MMEMDKETENAMNMAAEILSNSIAANTVNLKKFIDELATRQQSATTSARKAAMAAAVATCGILLVEVVRLTLLLTGCGSK